MNISIIGNDFVSLSQGSGPPGQYELMWCWCNDTANYTYSPDILPCPGENKVQTISLGTLSVEI